MNKLSLKSQKRVCPTKLIPRLSRMLTAQLAENELMAPIKKRRTKKQPTAAVPIDAHVDTTIFPFLRLPGEIRNMIYRYALVDTEYSVRFEAKLSKRDGRCIVKRMYRARPGPPDRDGTSRDLCCDNMCPIKEPVYPQGIFDVQLFWIIFLEDRQALA